MPAPVRIRDAIFSQPEEWKKAKRGLLLGGGSLTCPPRGYPAHHPLIQDLKRKDFVASVDLTQSQVCSGDHDRLFAGGEEDVAAAAVSLRSGKVEILAQGQRDAAARVFRDSSSRAGMDLVSVKLRTGGMVPFSIDSAINSIAKPAVGGL